MPQHAPRRNRLSYGGAPAIRRLRAARSPPRTLRDQRDQ
jgi:hypothetical protein